MRPSAASALSRLRIHSTPSGSRPFTGSSRTTTLGSPSNAEATPSRWPIPSENPPTRLPATSRSPTMSMTSSTRRRLIPLVWASASKWLRAERPVCMALASSSKPSSAIGATADRYRAPLTRTLPPLGSSSPAINLIVVDLPAPFGPRKPITTPGCTTKSRPSTASFSP